MTEKEKILDYLKRNRKITPLEYYFYFGHFRLAARIKELKDAGHKITTTLVFENGKRFARYTLNDAD